MGLARALVKGKGGNKSARCVCVYIGIGEHWEESIRRASEALP